MKLQLTTRQIGNVTVVDASGKMTLSGGARGIRDKIMDLLADGNRRFLVNMAGISSIDTFGVNELIATGSIVTDQVGTLRLIYVGKSAVDVVMSMRLNRAFEVFADEAKALASF